MSKHMTDKQMIPNDSDPRFQLNCEESYANYFIWAAVHGIAFIPSSDYKNSGPILSPLYFPLLWEVFEKKKITVIIIMITICAGSCDIPSCCIHFFI